MNDISKRTTDLSPEEKRALLAQLLQKKASQSQSLLPLSFNQQALWFLYKLAPQSWTYNVLFSARIRSHVDILVLEQAFQTLIERHPSLRTTYTSGDNKPVQRVHEYLKVHFKATDASTWSQSELNNRLVEEARHPFDLELGSVLRVNLFTQSATEHILMLVVHHIAMDLWSLTQLLDELFVLYSAQKAGTQATLPPLELQYTDYVRWQTEMLASAEGERLWSYWQRQLAGKLPVLNLPTAQPRPPVQTYHGASHTFKLSEELTRQLKKLGKAEEATLYMTLLAAFQVLLYRYTGQEDILVGSPTTGRSRHEFSKIVGHFVNPVVLRGDLSENPTFKTFLTRVRHTVLDALKHRDYPFLLLVERLHPAQDPSRSPLFQVMFILQKLQRFEELSEFVMPDETDTRIILGGLDLEPFALTHQEGQFDLTLEMIETTGGSLNGILKYNPDLFEVGMMRRMVGHFQTLLEGIVAGPEQHLSDLPVLTAAERHQLLNWNNTQADYPKDGCIHQLFEAQVEKTPDAIAVVFEDEQLTYRELNIWANQLAHHLRTLGVEPEVMVGICVERSLEMVVGLLGILKAGGAYVPLDPTYPKERLTFMINDTQVSVLLTQQRLVAKLPHQGTNVVCLDAGWEKIAQFGQGNPISEVRADNLAYVIYTSGSTGRPKGVSVIHRGVVRLVKGSTYVNLSAAEVFLQLAPISFDASTFEIWGCLLNGARLVVMPPHNPSLPELGHALKQYHVTTLWLTAGLFHLMVDEQLEDLKNVRQLLAGGEVLSVPHVQKLVQELKGCRLVNGYGPTESTTFTCCYPITELSQVGTSVSIGRPIANTCCFLLDAHLQPVPVGIPGELYIGGDGLARGYLNRPELSAEKFIPNPFSDEPGARLYKTGDLVRYLADSNIEFLGRIDNQVKIRGFRIELGEIETALAQHLAVRETVVIDREDIPGDKRLVAYIVFKRAHSAPIEELHHFLKQKLPSYMMPSAFVLLDTLPLTPNGKVDRRILPAPDQIRQEPGKTFVAPRDELELQLTKIWEKVLGIHPVGVKDNFFDLGGHSLLTARLVAEIAKVMNQKLPLAAIFQLSTVEQLASIIRKESDASAESASDVKQGVKSSGQTESTSVTLQPTVGLPLEDYLMLLATHAHWKSRRLGHKSLILETQAGEPRSRPPILAVGGMGELHKHLDPLQPVYSLPVHAKTNTPQGYVKALASTYIDEIRTMQLEGPFLVFGYCFGGMVAFEIACQLQEQGYEVSLLALVERIGPSSIVSHYRRTIWPWMYHCRQLLQLAPAEKLTYVLERTRRAIHKTKTVFKFDSQASPQANNNSDETPSTPPVSNRNDYEIKNLRSVLLNAQLNYTPQSYSGRVALFFSLEGGYQSFFFPRGGWGKLMTGAVDVHVIPGSSSGLLIEPNVRLLAEKLRSYIG